MLRISSLFALGCLSPLLSFAQVTEQGCKDIAESVAQGYDTSLNASQRTALRHYANCGASESESSAGVNIIYGAFGLGAKYDAAKRASSCSQEATSINTASTQYLNAKRIYKEGLEVVSQCLNLAGRSWNIKYKIYTDDVSVNIANLSASGSKLVAVDIIGADAVCKGLPTLPTLVTNAGVSFICTRTPRKNIVAGATHTEADEVTINVRLDDGPLPIRMPGYSKSPLAPMAEEIASLRAQVDQLTSAIATIRTAHGPETASDGGGLTSGVCPVGSYMVGNRFNRSSGGPHGIIYTLGPICRAVAR